MKINRIGQDAFCLAGLIAISTLLLSPALSLGAEGEKKTFSGVNVFFENDLFTGSDRNYTNGVKASFITKNLNNSGSDLAPLVKGISQTLYSLREAALGTILPLSTEDPKVLNPPNYKVEFAFGQNMYTPKDISSYELIPNDRPYAGWTYLSTAFHVQKIDDYMHTFEFQAGVVGPESLAEETQKYVHREISNSPQPNGWGHQLETELGLEFVYEQKHRLGEIEEGGLDFDAISHAGFALGNIHTYLNTGLEVRGGWNLPKDFGVSLIRPAGSTRLEPDRRAALYFFGAMDARLVGRDIFLDGNTFADSHSVSKKYLVADFAVGAALNYERFRLTWTNVYRTKEFDGQPDGHSFASITISFFF